MISLARKLHFYCQPPIPVCLPNFCKDGQIYKHTVDVSTVTDISLIVVGINLVLFMSYMWRIQDFQGGHQPQKGANLLFGIIFCQKLHENERNGTWVGRLSCSLNPQWHITSWVWSACPAHPALDVVGVLLEKKYWCIDQIDHLEFGSWLGNI